MGEIKDNNKRNDWQNPIYVSYAWPSETNTNTFVYRIIRELKQKKFKLKIDYECCDTDSILELENEIGRAKFVIIILSQKYFRSMHCMYEWTKIHEKKRRYKPIYVLIDGFSRFTKEPLDINITELRDFWDGQIKAYWEKIRSGSEVPTELEKRSNAYNFYYRQIGEIKNIISDSINKRSSDEDAAIDKIVEDIQRYINEEYAYDVIVERAKDIVFSSDNAILFVGDSILRFEGRPLGDYLNDKLFEKIKGDNVLCKNRDRYRNLREWNRLFFGKNCDDIKKRLLKNKMDDLKEEINVDSDSSSVLDKSLLIRMLDTNYFKLIITSGSYVKDIIISKYNDEDEKKNIDIISISDDGAIKTEPLITNRKDDVVDIIIFDLTTISNNDDSFLFSELSVVNMVLSFIEVFKQNKKVMNKDIEERYGDNSKVIALGTDLPGWALRFMWAAFEKHYSLINNKPTDKKSVNYLRTNNFYILEHYKITEHFVDCFVTLVDKYRVSTIDGCTNIYVFYFNKDYKDFINLYDTILMKIEKEFKKIHFVFNDKSEDIESKITNSQHYILYKFSKLTNDSNDVGELSNTMMELQRLDSIKKELKKERGVKKNMVLSLMDDLVEFEDIPSDFYCKYNKNSIKDDIVKFINIIKK